MEEFKEIKEKYEQLLKSFGSAMVLVDKENTIIFLNNEAQEILGMPENKVKGKNWTEITNTFEYEQKEIEIHTDVRPSTNAVFVGMESIRTCYLETKIDEIAMPRILVTILAIPILLNGQVGGGIIVFKKI